MSTAEEQDVVAPEDVTPAPASDAPEVAPDPVVVPEPTEEPPIEAPAEELPVAAEPEAEKAQVFDRAYPTGRAV